MNFYRSIQFQTGNLLEFLADWRFQGPRFADFQPHTQSEIRQIWLTENTTLHMVNNLYRLGADQKEHGHWGREWLWNPRTCSVLFLGKFTSNSYISTSRCDLLKLPNDLYDCQGGSARNWYLFRTSGNKRVGDFTSSGIWRGWEICHFGSFLMGTE